MVKTVEDRIWKLYAARVSACYPQWELISCTDPRGLQIWKAFIQAFSRESPKHKCSAGSEPFQETTAHSYSCAITLLDAGTMMAAVYLKVLERDGVRYGSVDSCTLPEYQNRGLNKVLRTLVYHALVTQFHCKYLYSYAVSPASMHVVTKHFGWQQLAEDSPLARRISEIDGDLVDVFGSYDRGSEAYRLLMARYENLCHLPEAHSPRR